MAISLEHAWIADALFRLADRTNGTGDAYFQGLVSGLADVLSVRWVYLNRLHPNLPRHAQVVAGWADGALTPQIEYDLAGTPCAEVLTGVACFYPTGVADRFPDDRMLSDLGVVGYAATPLRGAGGRAFGLLSVMHDQPLDASRSPCRILDLLAGRAAAELERSRVEAQLRRSKEEIQFISESTPAVLWRATPDGLLDYVSPRAADYCGTSPDSLLGRGYLAFLHPDDVAPTLNLWTHARGTGAPFEAEYRLRRADGMYRWQLARALARRDASGTITKWYGSVLDVDGRRRAAMALREADRRKDEFLALLGHELRNPLAPIRHALDVQARAGGDLQAWKDMRETIERQVAHLVRLVDDLLDVSRLTTGQIALHRELVDVREIVADALDTCRQLVTARKHRVTTELPSDPLMVHGDRIRLAQALTNVVNNAAKFTAPGGEIDIVASQFDGTIEIRVRDSGVGISEERLPRIFDLFSRSDASPDREHGGLGVGLTLARWVIDLHAGALSASSAGEGCGSEFRLRLPSTTAVPARRDAVPARRPPPSDSASAPHVLVIDDNVDATNALNRLLRIMGYSVTIAYDGKSGIDLAQQLRPDVILLDIGLPHMDGYAVARHLRSLPDLATARIIALTGYGHDASERVRAAGMDRHLIKPVDVDELLAALAAPA
ncbi:MAG: ATP-binding protein [Vicinamibacterales bacterium]